MDAASAETRVVPLDSHRGTRYSAEDRERVREAWFFLHSRNAEATARALQGEFPGLEGRTIRYWAAEEGWAAWGEDRLAALAPGIADSVKVDLIAGSVDAAAYLRAAVRGEAKAEPARVNAAVALLDRGGHARREGTEPLLPRPRRRAPVLGSAETPAAARGALLRSLLGRGDDEA